jgi:hypothetical protein
MAIYSAHQPFHPSMRQQTAQWTTTAQALAYFFFDHFYDGDLGFPPFLLAKFKPMFSW